MKVDLLYLIAANLFIGCLVALLAHMINSKREIIGGYPLIAVLAVVGSFMGSALPYLFGLSIDTLKNLSFIIEYGIPFAVSAVFALFFSRVLRKW